MNRFCKTCPERRTVPAEYENNVMMHGVLNYCNKTGKLLSLSRCDKKKK